MSTTAILSDAQRVHLLLGHVQYDPELTWGSLIEQLEELLPSISPDPSTKISYCFDFGFGPNSQGVTHTDSHSDKPEEGNSLFAKGVSLLRKAKDLLRQIKDTVSANDRANDRLDRSAALYEDLVAVLEQLEEHCWA